MEKVKRSDIIAGISIYSSRVSACIGVTDGEAPLNIVGLGRREGRFLGAKGVLDIDALSRAIRDSLDMAQEEANVETSKTLVAVSGGSINSDRSRGIIKLGPKGREVTEKNLRDVLKIADTVPISMEREIIHSIPQDYIVDGQSDIKNPVGLHGVKLEAETLIVTAHLPFLQNVAKSLNLAGADLDGVVYSGIAASKCLLSKNTEGQGVVLVEIDNNFTGLSVFFDNALIGIHISQKSVIADGVLEILRGEIDKARRDKPISKAILAGGGYIHEDFIEKVNKVFGIPSETAYLRSAKGTARDMNNPSYLASIGLVLCGFEEKKKCVAGKKTRMGVFGKATRKVGLFLEEYF